MTKNFGYQVCLQYFLGDINLLDMFATYQWDKFKLRFGKGLSPVLYEYYAFDPAFEPVITNSMSFQLANKRPLGATFIMNGKFLQLWAGIENNLVSGYYDVTRNPQFIGAATLTPFKETDGIFKHLGGGVGYSVGYENYALFDPNALGPNHLEQTTNDSWVTSSGVPFAVYNQNVRSVGQRTRVAPHLFWYGRFSFLAEYIVHSRELTDGTTTARSTQQALMFMASYYLTGERDYGGNGIQGFSSVEPIRPFLPSRGQWGTGPGRSRPSGPSSTPAGQTSTTASSIRRSTPTRPISSWSASTGGRSRTRVSASTGSGPVSTTRFPSPAAIPSRRSTRSGSATPCSSDASVMAR